MAQNKSREMGGTVDNKSAIKGASENIWPDFGKLQINNDRRFMVSRPQVLPTRRDHGGLVPGPVFHLPTQFQDIDWKNDSCIVGLATFNYTEAHAGGVALAVWARGRAATAAAVLVQNSLSSSVKTTILW